MSSLRSIFVRAWKTNTPFQVFSCLKNPSTKHYVCLAASKPLSLTKSIHTTSNLLGIEEFFEPPENIGKNVIKSGAPWSRDLLRMKNVEDLQKIWYILLKERNMLETMQYHYETIDEPMPSPERLEKVAESMSNLRDVLEEREKAQNMLLYGRATKHGGEYRKSGLGSIYWHQYKEHLIPKHLQKKYYEDQPADLATFSPKLDEWHLRFQEKKIKVRSGRRTALKTKWNKIRMRNPSLPKSPPEWWLRKFETKYKYSIHPENPIIF